MHLYAGRAHVLPRTRSAVVADGADVDLVAARVGEGDHLEVGVHLAHLVKGLGLGLGLGGLGLELG